MAIVSSYDFLAAKLRDDRKTRAPKTITLIDEAFADFVSPPYESNRIPEEDRWDARLSLRSSRY